MPDRPSSDFHDDSASPPNPEPSAETTRPVTPGLPPPEPRLGVGGSGSAEPGWFSGGESPSPEQGAGPSAGSPAADHTEVVNLAELRARTGAGPARPIPPGSPRRWDTRPPGAHSGPPSPQHSGPLAASPSPQQPESPPPAHQSGPPPGPQPAQSPPPQPTPPPARAEAPGKRRPAESATHWNDDAPPAGGWAGAGGFAESAPANWNYVDNIRSSELVSTRKIPPERGWRHVVLKATGGLINLGQSPDERRQAELEAKVCSLLRGHFKIGVLGKGGTGKTTIAVGVGSVFAKLRTDDRVVAIDADTSFGKLGSRIDPKASGSYWELAADRQLFTFADVRARVGSNAVGLFVLAGESATARRRVLDAQIYREATARLDNHFTMSIVDCGSTMDAQITQAVLSDVDALIVVSSPWLDGASSAGQILEWLANYGYTGLLHRTVVVLNDSDGHAQKRTRQVLADRFSSHGQKVIELPFDAHLRPGGVIDVYNELDAITQRRLLEIAAAIAEHFASTTDAPRERR
jgi:MinD-like ATPase involved in chromosome partitioning or flagellar assembly